MHQNGHLQEARNNEKLQKGEAKKCSLSRIDQRWSFTRGVNDRTLTGLSFQFKRGGRLWHAKWSLSRGGRIWRFDRLKLLTTENSTVLLSTVLLAHVVATKRGGKERGEEEKRERKKGRRRAYYKSQCSRIPPTNPITLTVNT